MASFCTNCGAPLDEGASFCTGCGTKVDALTTPNGEALSEDAALSGAAAGGDAAPAAVASSPTVTMPAGEVQSAVPAPTPIPTTAPMAAPPMPATASQPVYYTAPPATGAASNDKKTWMIVGIAAAAVIVVAAIVIAFMLLNPASATHRVTFETAGGTPVSSSEVDTGTSINEPAAPTRTDYKFDGWYLDSTYTNKVTFPYTVDEDTVMYAKWTEDKVTQVEGTSSTSTTQESSTSKSATSSSSGSTVTLTVVGADGSTRTADIHRSGSSQRVFPDSNSRKLSQSEVNALSDAEKCIAWNEIIAASNGYSFKNSGLRNYFNSCSWYHANAGASAGGDLSSLENANVKMLQDSCDSWWSHLATN